MKLNSEQRAAVKTDHERVVVTAGPGSGKSTVIVERVKRRVEDGNDPSKMVLLTFTNAGAKVFSDRLFPIVVEFAGTRHAYMLRLLQEHGKLLGYRGGTIGIASKAIQDAMFKEILAKHPKMSGKELQARASARSLEVRKEYHFQLKQDNMIDYDRILEEGLRLLQLDRIQSVLSLHVHELYVDEKQDDTAIDWEIDQLIPARMRFFVGDAKQAIFSFRPGSSPKGMLEYQSRGDVQHLNLTKNYRSGKAICEAASRLIAHNEGQEANSVVSASKEKAKLGVKSFVSAQQEVAWIIDTIRQEHQVRQVKESEIAILCRMNSQREPIIEALKSAGIPVARTVTEQLPEDWNLCMMFLEIMQTPANNKLIEQYLQAQGIGAATISHVKLEALTKGVSMFDCFIPPDSPLRQQFGGRQGIMAITTTLAKLSITSQSIDIIRRRVKALPQDRPTLSDLIHDLWNKDGWDSSTVEQGVTVTTLHGSKGREWEVVFIPQCEEGTIPKLLKDSDIEEERRLFFVGVTRAKNKLIITHAAVRTAYYAIKQTTPSRFIQELQS